MEAKKLYSNQNEKTNNCMVSENMQNQSNDKIQINTLIIPKTGSL